MRDSETRLKKSVALSGLVAGDTAVCSVGHTGNDLHYRGYDVRELATHASFEEVAWLLIHGALPTRSELESYRAELQRLRGLPVPLRKALEEIPRSAHPMDVLRTGCSLLGALEPEEAGHTPEGARAIANRLLASYGSMLLYWYHFAYAGRRIEVENSEPGIAGHFLSLLHGRPPTPAHTRALDRSLVLYAEHEFNASTFTARVIAGTGSDFYSAVCGAIGALRGPKHGGANEAAIEIMQRYVTPDEAEADIVVRLQHKEIVIGFGHPVYTELDPRAPIIKVIARRLCEAGATCACSRSRSESKRRCGRPGACSRISTGTARPATECWISRRRCSRRSSRWHGPPDGRHTSSSSDSTTRSSAPAPTTPAPSIARSFPSRDGPRTA